MNAQQIIQSILAYYNLNNNELAEILGVNHSRIDFLVNGRTKSITPSTAKLLLQHFPMLNPLFVTKGFEPMHISEKTADRTILTVRERIELILQQYQLTTTELCNLTGWQTQAVTLMRSGTYKSFSQPRIKQLLAAFPDLNPTWLLSGAGDMFVNDRKIDNTLPMPKPFRNYKEEKQLRDQGYTKEQAIILANNKPTTPVFCDASQKKTNKQTLPPSDLGQQEKINSLILEELRNLHKEIEELRKERDTPSYFAAEPLHKD